jgi:GT2 family glycosyltransferase
VTCSLSLVVCTLDRPEATARLLRALREQDRPADEVLVVDASQDDRTAAVVAEAGVGWPGVLRHRPARGAERGLTRQRNVGLAETTGTLVAFLDDDTVPDPGYVGALVRCFERHPEAVGVGGVIVEAGWRRAGGPRRPGWYRTGGWERREGLRWTLRALLGLGAGAAGQMPESGHGRPVAFLPPDGQDRVVEFVMGGASAWRRPTLERHRFDPGFAGYGLYEDLDLCISAGADGPLVVAGDATLSHHHAPEGRPDHRRYGRMVVVNGWYVWRRRWPHPSRAARLRWWSTTALLAVCRAAGGAAGRAEARGRAAGMVAVLPCEHSRQAVRRRFVGHDHVEDVAAGVGRG